MVDDAIRAAGGPTKLARALGLDHSTIIGWRRIGRVPAERVRKVSEVTGIAAHLLRPDLFDPPPSATKAEAA